MTFKVKAGDLVAVASCRYTPELKGLHGTVIGVHTNYTEVDFPGWRDGHNGSGTRGSSRWNFFPNEDGLELVKAANSPSIAQDLKLKPQTKTVLRHIEKRGSISPMEALITHGISRLAPCIYDLRQAGYLVHTEIRRDEQGHRYSSYSFPKCVEAAA